MHHRVRHVNKKRALLVLFDERYGALGVLRGELFLILAGNFGVNDLILLDERQVRPTFEALFHRQMQHAGMVRPHVVRVRQAEVVVKPVLHRQELFVVAEVPFTVDGCGVVLLFADLGKRHFVGVNAVPGAGPQRAEDADAHVVAAGKQSRP